MMFFLPDVPEAHEVSNLITRYGGLVCEYHECCTIQIKPNQGSANFDKFYLGKIYSETYVVDCIKAQKLINKEDYLLLEHKNDKKCLTIGLSKKKRFTIMEGVMMYDVMGGH